MANITKKVLKDGTITYRFRACVGRDPSGAQVWRTRTISSPGLTPAREQKEVKRLADEWEIEEKADYARGLHDRRKDNITLSEFVKSAWMPVHVKNGDAAANSVVFYEFSSKIVCDFMGDMKLKQITTEDCARFVAYLNTEATKQNGEPYSKTTRTHIFGTLRNIMRTAKRWRYIKREPTEDLEGRERPQRDKKPVTYLTPDEAEKFLDALQSEPINKRALFTLLIYEGMRRGEAVALQWKDIDEEHMTITVSKSATLDKSKPNGRDIKSTKTGEARVIPLHPDVLPLLKDLKTDMEKRYKIKLAPGAYVFCEVDDPKTPIYPTTPTRWMQQLVKKHKLRKCTVHELRRTCCTTLLHNGIDAKTVCSISGHADANTLYRYYSGTNEQQAAKALNTIKYSAG